MGRYRPCDIFISYSEQSGKRDAKKLADAIEKKGLQPFAFEYSLTVGRDWDEQVLKELRYCRCVIVLVPSSGTGLTDWMNHEVGIARAMKKVIIPIALGDNFRSSASMSGMLSRYWGCPLNEFLRNLDSFVVEPAIGSAAWLTVVWSPYLVSGSTRIVVGGIDPAGLQDPKRICGQDLAGDYFSIGVFRGITRLFCFFSQQFGADFLDELLIAQKTGPEEISKHDLIVIGGPNSLQKSPLEDYHRRLAIHYEGKAYLVGSQKYTVATKSEPDGFRREACVFGLARNPMSSDREMLLVSGDSGYGCQGAIEYLVDTRIDPGLAAAVDHWRDGPRDTPLLFDLSTQFEPRSNTYVKGSGVPRQIEIGRAR
jgi:hypothetical protein